MRTALVSSILLLACLPALVGCSEAVGVPIGLPDADAEDGDTDDAPAPLGCAPVGELVADGASVDVEIRPSDSDDYRLPCASALSGPADVEYLFTAPESGSFVFSAGGGRGGDDPQPRPGPTLAIYDGACSQTLLACIEAPLLTGEGSCCGGLGAVELEAGQLVTVALEPIASWDGYEVFTSSLSVGRASCPSVDFGTGLVPEGAFPSCLGAFHWPDLPLSPHLVDTACPRTTYQTFYRYVARFTGEHRFTAMSSEGDPSLEVIDGGSCSGASSGCVVVDRYRPGDTGTTEWLEEGQEVLVVINQDCPPAAIPLVVPGDLPPLVPEDARLEPDGENRTALACDPVDGPDLTYTLPWMCEEGGLSRVHVEVDGGEGQPTGIAVSRGGELLACACEASEEEGVNADFEIEPGELVTVAIEPCGDAPQTVAIDYEIHSYPLL